MRAVKILVAFMGLLIVIGIGLVAYGLSLDKNKTAPQETVSEPAVPLAGGDVSPQPAPVAVPEPLSDFGDISVDMAANERLVGYSRQGNQITLQIDAADNSTSRLVIVSIDQKKVLGRVILGAPAQ